MKKLYFLVTFLICVHVFGQKSDEEQVKSTINQMFLGMKNVDSTSIKNAFTENAILQSINSKSEIRTDDFKKFATSVVKFQKNDLDERIVFESIKIDQNLATVWTPYQFYFKGTFSHCGVNHFVLIKQNNQWKIQYLIDTRRKENCVKNNLPNSK